jgi:hypothetical protein
LFSNLFRNETLRYVRIHSSMALTFNRLIRFLFHAELLRKTSEHVLIDMVQLLFARLPQFRDDEPSVLALQRVNDLSTREMTTNTQTRVIPESLMGTSRTKEPSNRGRSSLRQKHPASSANTFTLASDNRSSSPASVPSETVLPIILSSFNESSSNLLQTKESAITLEEGQQPSPETASTNPIEYMQTKDISIGSSADGTPMKGR